ncbi:hypothetical protein [Kineosporia sp. NBRC 101731]|uniref:hypothetical protein n=1 Tax=Kineosporia sp. NBRC 101731 TaxID=3032199 RepID=UPI0024A455B1|nr:hypothetical protein [Kineosporia sp. NBRC 101731]GLY28113.1 hypothetical protein Kisp02_14780 [Kineosporia sp. NBRC 101731]
MGDRVEVDPASLNKFAKVVSALAADHAEAAVTHPEDLGAYSGAMFVEASNFREALTFADYHNELSRSIQAMLGDAIAGLESLGNGAEYCAVNYLNSDQGNAAVQRRVDSALGPVQENNYVAPGNSPEEVLIRKEDIYNRQHLMPATKNSGYGDDGFELTTSSGRTIDVAPEPDPSSGD